MQQQDPTNHYFQLAVQFVNYTAKHLFLTGKAGTGKTTFLKYIHRNCPKKLAILAPTGVAAINAGGVTIHSFFQLPFGSFLPAQNLPQGTQVNFFNSQSLLKHLKLNSSKRSLMQELELLIIDEVSMVRADLLDAMDTVLRHVRRNHKPFGGIQMLFIGDLYQLPPVVKDEENRVLHQYYSSSFFFHAKVLQEAPPVYLDLKKIYRQSDKDFIKLLNNLRNNEVKEEDIALLKRYYKPNFIPESKGEYITLTSHNAKAAIINQQELNKLPGKTHCFNAEIGGEINEHALPAENKLILKEGSQVMFVRNDKDRRYYNGKTAIITRIKGEEIYVTFPDEKGELKVEKESWSNVRYAYNQESDQVEENIKGTFVQYPLRLAWAITIHKSQGLTFAKAIVDAGDSFAAGQVYVALSRLTSLDGLILKSPINASCIRTDQEAKDFAETEPDSDSLQKSLKEAQRQFIHESFIQGFSWHKLFERVYEFKVDLPDRRIPLQSNALALLAELFEKVAEHKKVADKFLVKLEQLLITAEADGYHMLHERTVAATSYFIDTINKSFAEPLQLHIDSLIDQRKKAKKHLQELKALLTLFNIKILKLEQIVKISYGLKQGNDAAKILENMAADNMRTLMESKDHAPTKEKPKSKLPKGETMRISLRMFREGRSITEIASERGLAIGTIEGHLCSFLCTGEVSLEELVSPEKAVIIQEVLDRSTNEMKSSEVREILGETYTFGEIRAVISSRQKV
ncbi:helix-turn-helix domain-containing protein [Anditalea andensis]|uniref:Helicase n=1 Tax=Anditalea andensis TaxID=1048983 RepID=A0A074KW62_9BACT|nr:helix-turn-helix domain-containing protein [Anditalea andensis]KEO74206.1 helicase [Anditalea andensis]